MTQSNQSSVVADWMTFRDGTTNGRSAEVIKFADHIIADGRDPQRVAQAMIEKLVAQLNMGEIHHLGPLMDEIQAVLRGTPDPRLVGEFYAVAAAVAFEHGSLGTAMMNLGRAERALRRMSETNVAAVDAWHDLAVVYSSCGFHAKALNARAEAVRVCEAAGLSPAFAMLIEAQVRAAVDLDQRGDTEGCIQNLRSIVTSGRSVVTQLAVAERVYLRYALARLAALGRPDPLTIPADAANDLLLTDVNRLSEVCAALATPDPAQALARLDDAPSAIDVLGPAEPRRLRSLALSLLGDVAGALAAERETLRLVMAEDRQLRELVSDSVNARLDQDRLRRVAMQYADEAYTDPLTGLPNRRRSTEVAAELVQRGVAAMLGVLDLDGFKAVNDTHGHPSGDLVLQRVAGIFARGVRQGDLLSRHGGDEFVVILPKTTAREAREIGSRLCAAVRNEDWSALVPDTPVSASIGWAVLDRDLNAALKEADKDLYRTKRGAKRAA